MSEPREVADGVEALPGGVWHWRIHNANIGGELSSSHAVAADGGCVLIDPVRLAEDAFATLPPPDAILLTATCHQRAAWRYRGELGIEVWAPLDARAGDESPDRQYAEGDPLPGGLRAVRTPGPELAHYSLVRDHEPAVLFCSDLISSHDGRLDFVPFEFHDDPAETRRSVERLLDLDFSILCFDHGAPLTDDPKGAIRELLVRA